MWNDLKQIYNYREMLKTTVSKEVRARYKGSVLGFLWTFLNPLMQLAVYALVFKYVMRVSTPGINYTLYLFVGLVAWTCFSSSLLMGVTTIVSNSNLVKKIYFPRLILPLSSVLGNVVNMLLASCIVLPVLWINSYFPNINYLYLPLILILQTILSLGIVLLVSSIYVYFRDLEHILSIIVMAWMYLTPVIYSEEMVPARFYSIFKLNPLFPIITAYQRILLYNAPPEIGGLLYLAAFCLFSLYAGYLVFNKLQRRFAEEL